MGYALGVSIRGRYMGYYGGSTAVRLGSNREDRGGHMGLSYEVYI